MSSLPSDLAAIRARCEAATPGPWEQRLGDSIKENLVADVRGLTIYGPHKAVSCGAEADFIVHAREDLPRLLARLEEMREVVLDLTHGQADLHKQRGTAPLCDWCGFSWPCAYKVAAEALRPLGESR